MEGSKGPLGGTPGALIRMGCALMGAGKGAQAHALLESFLARNPDDPELRSAERIVLSHRIPHWHEAMLADAPRNEAFEQAIQRAAPGKTVLDIGTGTGLLAMMAARAGAAKVVACEAHPALAETARQIVAANGFGDRIEVHAGMSTELDPAADLGGGADVIVAEVFSDDLLNEGALKTLQDAAARLGKAGARIVPARASVRVALACRELPAAGLGDVCGFDLSKFERHMAPARKLPAGDKALKLRSEALDLFEFDFEARAAFPPARTRVPLVSAGGTVNGIAQWIRLDLDEAVSYENRPAPGAASHWAALFYPLPKARETERGETVWLNAAHDGERLQLWSD